jgi:hypothetical protein
LEIKEAKRIVRDTIVALGGPRLTYKDILCSKNEKGVSRVVFSPRGRLKMINISPPTYWRENQERLIALAAHEYANRFFTQTSEAENLMSLELNRIDREYVRFPELRVKKRLAKKADYEINHSVILDQLLRTLKVDAAAIQMLRQRQLPLSGYTEYLTTELEETAKFSLPRRTWHVMAFLLRLAQAEKIIANPNHDPRQFFTLLETFKSSD